VPFFLNRGAADQKSIHFMNVVLFYQTVSRIFYCVNLDTPFILFFDVDIDIRDSV
jgi:hypothetical protein